MFEELGGSKIHRFALGLSGYVNSRRAREEGLLFNADWTILRAFTWTEVFTSLLLAHSLSVFQ